MNRKEKLTELNILSEMKKERKKRKHKKDYSFDYN